MIVLLGYSSCGKTTIAKELEKHGYKRLVTTTNRPMRPGEINGLDYEFITTSEFIDRFLSNDESVNFTEMTWYNTADGIWMYGSNSNQYGGDVVAVLNIDGVRQLRKRGIDLTTVYIKADEEELKARLINRGDNEREYLRRLKSDRMDFENVDGTVDLVIDTTNESVETSTEKILKYIGGDKVNRKLYIDFDCTIVNSVKRICEMYNEDFCYYPHFLPARWDKVEKWDFSDECPLASSDIIDNYFCQPRFFNGLEFMDNAKEVLMELYKYHPMYIVTMGEIANLKLKKRWLKDNLPYFHLYALPFDEYADKSCVDMSDGILIDDNASYLNGSNAEIKILFGDVYEWNKDCKEHRCYNWYEVEEYIRYE